MAKQKILVVDDDPPVVEVVEFNLKLEGYEVVAAYDGEEALEKVKTEKPDLIILDLGLPKKDGWQVFQELKEHPSTRGIPVIMLTAKAQNADIVKGWASGVDGYVTKPFDVLELMAMVKGTLRMMEE